MKVVLTGATGFVGSEVLKQLIGRSEIAQVPCVVRRPISMQSPQGRDGHSSRLLNLRVDVAIYRPASSAKRARSHRNTRSMSWHRRMAYGQRLRWSAHPGHIIEGLHSETEAR